MYIIGKYNQRRKAKVVLALKSMNSIYIAAICGGIGAALAMLSKKNDNKDNKKK